MMMMAGKYCIFNYYVFSKTVQLSTKLNIFNFSGEFCKSDERYTAKSSNLLLCFIILSLVIESQSVVFKKNKYQKNSQAK